MMIRILNKAVANKPSWLPLFRRNTSTLKPFHRCCSSEVVGSPKNDEEIPINKISLATPVPGLPIPHYVKITKSTQETKVTILDNGLKVASEPKYGNFCTVGVVIDSGSRYEAAYPSGISHFLEKLAFGNTVNMTTQEVKGSFETLGGIADSQYSRDAFIYATSVKTTALDKVVDIMGEVTLRPTITEDEVANARMAISFDLENLKIMPEKDRLLTEMVHAAAFRDNTLGLPNICLQENINTITSKTLFTYLKHHHTPNRMVLAGVGVDHDALVEAAQKYFVDRPAIWESDPSVASSRKIDIDDSISQYTGGSILEEADLSDVSIGPNPLPDLAHLVIGLRSVSHHHDDFVATCILNNLMGGGESFSAGGPGKGMYTRLYTNVLNRYTWIYKATACNHAYSDNGLFCIHASAPPTHLAELTRVLTREFVGMAGKVGKEELERAKNQLQSMLLMALESRAVIYEDIGRQVLATGKRLQPTHYLERIKKITADDIVRVSSEMLHSKPTLAAMGSLNRLPKFSNIQSGLLLKL